jgi:ABC-2 type transport system permease protein
MIARQFGSEVRWMLRRPRTLIGLFGLVLVPIIISFGIWTAGSDEGGGGPPGLGAILQGNGMVVPIFTLFLSLNLLLPLVASIWAADGLAGEAQHGTLRGLLVAPVSRVRLLFVKLFGLTAMSLFAVTLMAVVGIISGTAFLGTDGMMTLSGTTLSTAEGLVRIGLFILLVTFQMVAVGAVALAVSATTEHPLVVQAATMVSIIVFQVLGQFSSLDWLHPFLITTGFPGLIDVMRDPIPWGQIGDSTLLAACYLLIGTGLAAIRLITKDS